MAISEQYRQQVSLLVRVLPLVARENCFALKGGTAINLFVRDLPRLSVDIDLAYLPVHERDASLTEIDAALGRISASVTRGIPDAQVTNGSPRGETRVNKLSIKAGASQVKVEVTTVLRGCVYEPETRPVSARVEAEFGFARMQVVSFADLYAGKIVAALDRQHPRDLFDVWLLLENEGIDENLRTAFVVYLLSHNRPLHEVVRPRPRNITQEYASGFEGMTDRAVPAATLLEAREKLAASVSEGMADAHKELLISFVKGNPDWSLIGIPGISELPAIRWRAANLGKLTNEQRDALAGKLATALETTR